MSVAPLARLDGLAAYRTAAGADLGGAAPA